MFGVLLSYLLFHNAVSQDLLDVDFLRGGKPGACPVPFGFDFGICPFYCRQDSSCALNMKCCPTKCGGLACAVPIDFTAVAAVEAVEAVESEDETSTAVLDIVPDTSAKCPGPLFDVSQCRPLKFATCTKDSHCVANMKCCFNGCVKTCRAPQQARSGFCPTMNRRCRRKVCSADSDCAQGFKCCSGGCMCSMPRGLGVGFGG